MTSGATGAGGPSSAGDDWARAGEPESATAAIATISIACQRESAGEYWVILGEFSRFGETEYRPLLAESGARVHLSPVPQTSPTVRPSRVRVRPLLIVALMGATAWGGRVAWGRAHRAARDVAWTTCPFFGPPVVKMVNDIPWYDTLVTRVHEEKHAEQCRQMGPVQYRLHSFTSAGKLSVETPAFCAAAAARLTVDPDSQYVNDRLHTDMIEGLIDVADSTAIKSALRKECPTIATQPRRTRARITPHASANTPVKQ